MPWYCVECGKVNPDGVGACGACSAPLPVKSVRISSARLRIPDIGAPARPSLSDGAKISHFRLEQHIASGGFATVHLARDVRSGEEYALKVLASNLVRNQKLVARFRQEARIQRSLIHPGIVRVFDVVEDGGNIALVMEYVRGLALDALMEKLDRPLALSECCEILVPMLDALEYAHRASVVHRDLKPSNVLLEANPQLPFGFWPKITDFGVAKLLDEAGVRTATGTTLGTWWYMAPEQCRGEKSIDHRADVYAVGVMLFEMVTRTVPFTGESHYAILEGHIRRAPPRPSLLNPAVPAALEAVILQAIEKEPGERFQSAIALRDALQAARTGVPLPTSQFSSVGAKPSVGASGPSWVARHRRSLLGGLAAAITVAIAFTIASWPDGQRPAPGLPPTPGSSTDHGLAESPPPPVPPPDGAPPTPGPTVPSWPRPDDPCAEASCPTGWPPCPEPSTGLACYNDGSCGECAEDIFRRGGSAAELATAMCVGFVMLERSLRSGEFLFQGWAYHLVGRAWEEHGCRRKAVEAYQNSVRQRCLYELEQPGRARRMTGFQNNLQEVIRRCNQILLGACNPCPR
ncbi:MAG: protein kinase [Myxococcota bacterium]|nr:protein kinase [Myxococcota bacterium]